MMLLLQMHPHFFSEMVISIQVKSFSPELENFIENINLFLFDNSFSGSIYQDKMLIIIADLLKYKFGSQDNSQVLPIEIVEQQDIIMKTVGGYTNKMEC